MNKEEKIELRNYLFSFLSENKRELFSNILSDRTKHLTLVLEDIYQSHNTSAVLRSAEIFGIQDVYIIENKNTFVVNPDVSMGSTKWIDIHKFNQNESNTIDCLETLKEKGYTIAVTMPHGEAIAIEDLPITSKIALIFGNEKHGLSTEAIQKADIFVKIPMFGFTESFNISVSAAIALYSLMGRIRESKTDWHLTEDEILELELQWAQSSIKKVELLIEKYYQEKSS